MSDARTRAVYDSRAKDYALATDDLRRDPLLLEFIARLPHGARVLDLGCGPGHMAAEMADRGLSVEAWDISPEMLCLASGHPGVTTRLAGFGALDAVRTYDGIWANFSLLHAPRRDFPSHLGAIHRALKPGGLFHIALKTGTGESRDSLGRFYSYFTPADLSGLLTQAGFDITSTTTGSGTGLAGTNDPWIAMLTHA